MLLSKANEAFVAENYEDAVELYTQAIGTDAGRDEFYANRAHAYIKLENYKDAVTDAEKAIELNPQNSKAYLRKGLACFFLGEYLTSKLVLEEGQKVEGSDKQFGSWIRKCEAEIDLAKNKALGQDADVDIGVSDKQEKSTTEDTTCKSSKITTSQQSEKPAGIPMPTGAKSRFDWYQTETQVVITILLKNIKKEDVKINIEEKLVSATVKLPNGGDYSLELDLAHSVVADKSIYKVLSTKIEIKLKKQEGLRWLKLESDQNEESKIKQFNPSSSSGEDISHKYPSSAHCTTDWDKLVTEIKKEEKEEKPEGDAALNDLFQQIYSDGSEEVKKAMNKSFSESGGTVLSTNWKDIGTKKTDIKPPDGMEYKKYDT